MATRVIKLGLVGAQDESFRAIESALLRQDRLAVQVVFDPCLQAARALSENLAASAVPSLEQLLKQVEGVIFADVRWMGAEPMVRSMAYERPMLLLMPVLASLSQTEAERLRHFSDLTTTPAMPGLDSRWGRSTLRLRELTATRLGDIVNIVLRYRDEGRGDRLRAVDWCTTVTQSMVRTVESTPDGQEWTLTLQHGRPGAQPVTATIAFVDSPASQDATSGAAGEFSAEVTCRNGRVEIMDERTLRWSTETGTEEESLNRDRVSGDLMLDLFGRRLVGGLVPVPGVDDLLQANRVLTTAAVSQRTGERLPIIR